MQKRVDDRALQHNCPARLTPLAQNAIAGLEGVLLADTGADEGTIAVIYDHGDNPPEITIVETAAQVLTVHANGTPVAVVAQAEGPRLEADDVLLVERFLRQKASS